MTAGNYDVSEMQDLEQIRLDLTEENHRIKVQEEKLKHMFDKLKMDSLKIKKEKMESQ